MRSRIFFFATSIIVASIPVSPALRAQDSTWFRDVTTSVGLDSIANYFMYVGDVDGDDYPDVLLEAGVQDTNQLRLFMNRPGSGGPADRVFVETTVESGINSDGRISDLAAMADVDNDSDIDIVTATYYYALKSDCSVNFADGGRCNVLLNDGSGHFVVKNGSGLPDLGPIPGSALSFLDYDRDGNIDLFIGTHYLNNFCDGIGARKYLMKGHGDGTFEDVTETAGLLAYTSALFGSNVGDWNNDGNQDIFTSIYGVDEPGNLWRNNGDGTFTDVAAEAGYNPHWMGGDNGQGMVPWAAEPYDYDNDGDMDITFLLVHGGTGSTEGRSTIFTNQGPAAGYHLVPELSRITRNSPQSTHHGDNQGRWLDFDNNGLSDLVITECVYKPATDRLFFLKQDSLHKFNDITGALGFITGTAGSGIKPIVKNPHAAEPIDYDLDGDDDLMVARYPNDKRFLLLRNDIGQNSHHVAVKLRAPAGVNRSGIGARITVASGDLTMTRDIYAGQGNFGGQQPFILNFGLGSRTAIDSIVIRWPDALLTRTVVHNPPIDQMVMIGVNGLIPLSTPDSELPARLDLSVRTRE